MAKQHTIGEVAETAGVSVRTLRHYDELGLLTPAARSAKGYRLYGDAELARLQQILIHRALGMPLESIRRVLDDPDFDRPAALRRQRQELAARVRRSERMIATIDRTLASLERGERVDAVAMFDGFDPSAYEAEAEERWGETGSYAEAARRTRSYGPADWAALKIEAASILSQLAALQTTGAAADGEEATALAEAHRQHIDRWFYPCDSAMHAGLADLYESDARFAANIDVHGDGLTPYLVAAIRANRG